jgi:hypothetical protein
VLSSLSRPIQHMLLPLGLLVLLIMAGALLLTLVRRHRVREIYRLTLRGTPRGRLFLASLSFFVTFATVRTITHAIRAGIGGVRNIEVRGMHIHHLVWGILLLLITGYGWLLYEEGKSYSRRLARALSLAFGIGAALTLDEFALWLHLRDVYWEREGRTSIDALLLFGALLAISAYGRPFLHALVREAQRTVRGASARHGRAAGNHLP